MSAKEIVIQSGYVVSATPQGAGIPVSPAFQYVPVPSPMMKAGNQSVLVQMLTVIGAGCSSPGGKCTGSGVINATAAKTKSNNMPVLRQGDKGVCNGVATLPNGSASPTACQLEITFAGQVLMKGE